MHFRKISIIALLIVSGLCNSGFSDSKYERFIGLFSKKIDSDSVDYRLLERAIVFYTNKMRIAHNVKPCSEDQILIRAARAHSREMSEKQYFSHTSPVPGNTHLSDRLKKEGMILENVVIGENLSVDFILDISGKIFYTVSVNGKKVYMDSNGDKEILTQTYEKFARSTVEHWMSSHGHRRNLLNENFQKVGIGVARGKYKGLDAIYVTQNFAGKLFRKRLLPSDNGFNK